MRDWKEELVDSVHKLEAAVTVMEFNAEHPEVIGAQVIIEEAVHRIFDYIEFLEGHPVGDIMARDQ